MLYQPTGDLGITWTQPWYRVYVLLTWIVATRRLWIGDCREVFWPTMANGMVVAKHPFRGFCLKLCTHASSITFFLFSPLSIRPNSKLFTSCPGRSLQDHSCPDASDESLSIFIDTLIEFFSFGSKQLFNIVRSRAEARDKLIKYRKTGPVVQQKAKVSSGFSLLV